MLRYTLSILDVGADALRQSRNQPRICDCQMQQVQKSSDTLSNCSQAIDISQSVYELLGNTIKW